LLSFSVSIALHAHERLRTLIAFSLLRIFVFRRPGGSSEEHEPDPIPNSAVKLLSANGTMA
jgi:hypothetical protein